MFFGCKKLESVGLGEGHTSVTYRMFSDCERLSSVFFPVNILEIEGYAFDGCLNFDTFLLPSSVTTLHPYAFYGCGGEFMVSPDVVGIEKFKVPNIFTGNKFTSVSFMQGFWELAERSFAGSTKLEKVEMGGFVTVIPEYCFYDCPNLEVLEIKAGIEVIHSNAFDHCPKIREFVAPNTLEFIGDNAFAECDSMRRIILNEGLKTIGYKAFSRLEKIEKIVIPSTVSVIGVRAFEYCAGKLEMNCELDDSITQYSNIFDMNKFTQVKIGDGVTRVAKNLFSGSRNLEKITLPATLKEIGDVAFSDCGRLTEIKIPADVTKIGSDAFYGCDAIEDVYVFSVTPPSVYYPFSYVTYEKATLYVPEGSKEAYMNAEYWKNFYNIKEVLSGDINNDSVVDVVDVTILVSMILDPDTSDITADINDDGLVDIADVTNLVSMVLGQDNN